jgi:hypothetical protein
MRGSADHRLGRAVALALLGWHGAAGASPPATDPPPAPSDQGSTQAAGASADGAGLATLRRVVRHFDFEDAEQGPVEMPAGFRRIVAADRGFLHFGRIQLTRSSAAGGRWSLEMSIDGGGALAAEIPPGIIPVLPLADYAVQVRVRTLDLEHARARLVAWFHDAEGWPIAASRTESEATSTDGRWETLTVTPRGDFPEAASLALELQLLQPAQRGVAPAPESPVRFDVRGRAWFDELTIAHVPRIDLRTQSPLNVITRPDAARLSLLVRDVTSESLMAQLVVTDLEGVVVFERAMPAPRGRQPLVIDLPLDRCGWYEARAEVRGPTRRAGGSRLRFAVVPKDELVPRTDPTLGVVLGATSDSDLARTAPLVHDLGAGSAIVPIWDARVGRDAMIVRAPAQREMIEALLEDGVEVTLALGGVPRELARDQGLDGTQVLEILARDPEIWEGDLASVLLDFGLRIRAWQLGAAREPDAFEHPDLAQLAARASSGLGQSIPAPTIVVPQPADRELPTAPAIGGVHVRVPPAIRPPQVATYAESWARSDLAVTVSFETLPEASYGPRGVVVDLLRRGLYAWRAGVPRIAIDAPWSPAGGAGDAEPDPAFAAWRGLAEMLRHRRFAGELEIGPGAECWLMRGEHGAADALVAWDDTPPGAEGATARLIFEDRVVHLVDAMGNRSRLDPPSGVHDVALGELPVLIEGINLPLARFRAGITVEPAHLPSQHRAHERALVVRNPWPVGIAGTLRLTAPDELELSPRRVPFSVEAGAEARVPLTFVFDRGIVAGPRTIEIEAEVTADRSYHVRTAVTVDVGWREIELTPSWVLARNVRSGEQELIVTQRITNRGDRPINLQAFLAGPGLGQNRRAIGTLHPGATAVKSFRVPGAVPALSGRTLRVGVSELDGVAVLNQLITLPDLTDLAE